jgi:hypothetical protein
MTNHSHDFVDGAARAPRRAVSQREQTLNGAGGSFVGNDWIENHSHNQSEGRRPCFVILPEITTPIIFDPSLRLSIFYLSPYAYVSIIIIILESTSSSTSLPPFSIEYPQQSSLVREWDQPTTTTTSTGRRQPQTQRQPQRRRLRQPAPARTIITAPPTALPLSRVCSVRVSLSIPIKS